MKGMWAMAIHPMIPLDNVIREYRNYFQTEFQIKDPELRIYPIRIRIPTPSPAPARKHRSGVRVPSVGFTRIPFFGTIC